MKTPMFSKDGKDYPGNLCKNLSKLSKTAKITLLYGYRASLEIMTAVLGQPWPWMRNSIRALAARGRYGAG